MKKQLKILNKKVKKNRGWPNGFESRKVQKILMYLALKFVKQPGEINEIQDLIVSFNENNENFIIICQKLQQSQIHQKKKKKRFNTSSSIQWIEWIERIELTLINQQISLSTSDKSLSTVVGAIFELANDLEEKFVKVAVALELQFFFFKGIFVRKILDVLLIFFQYSSCVLPTVM